MTQRRAKAAPVSVMIQERCRKHTDPKAGTGFGSMCGFNDCSASCAFQGTHGAATARARARQRLCLAETRGWITAEVVPAAP